MLGERPCRDSALALHQRFMRAHLHDLPRFENDDTIRVHDGGKSMSDHKASATLHQL